VAHSLQSKTGEIVCLGDRRCPLNCIGSFVTSYAGFLANSYSSNAVGSPEVDCSPGRREHSLRETNGSICAAEDLTWDRALFLLAGDGGGTEFHSPAASVGLNVDHESETELTPPVGLGMRACSDSALSAIDHE
jgi:hypothetical protein